MRVKGEYPASRPRPACGFPDFLTDMAMRQVNAVEITDCQDDAPAPGGHRIRAPDNIQWINTSNSLNRRASDASQRAHF